MTGPRAAGPPEVSGSREGPGPAAVSVIVPTYNEAGNLPVLLERVAAALQGEDYEVVVVDDDSPDGTWRVAESQPSALRARVLRRRGERGLARAVVAGFAAARGGILVVIDADLSHPPETIPGMVALLRSGTADVVVASRFVAGGGTEGWPAGRKATSYLGTWLARPLTEVRDPLSGFFALRREVIEGVTLHPRGYKIGLEILVRGRARRVREVPILFRDRTAGESKIGMRQNLEFLLQLAALAALRLRGRSGPE